LDLERQHIERSDFSAARRGYDPEEVESHLREIAEAVEQLKKEVDNAPEPAAATPASTVAGQAADRVRSIVEAAEESAAKIESTAQAEADRLTSEAQADAESTRASATEDARRTRDEAEAAAGEHVSKVQEATSKMLVRADTIEGDLDGLIGELRSSIELVVSNLRTGAASLSNELDEIRAGLVDVREAGPGGGVYATELEHDDDDTPVEEAAAEEEAAEPAPEPDEQYEDQDTVERAAVAVSDEDEGQEDEEEAAESADADGDEGARLIALNMALNGTPREETARYLEENFELSDQDAILDEVYARAGG
jgi:DivIVA domain-containing protein